MINFKKNRLKYLLWILSVALASLYIHCMIYFPLDPFNLNPILLVKIFFIAIICNLGLAFVTFDISKIYKKIATILFVPSLIITPVIVGLYFIPAFFIMLFANIYFFIKLNPWRKDEMGPLALKSEAKKEVYKLIDKHLRKLPKNQDGTINEFAEGFDDNDVDALRHAYVSGVFTQEYGELSADIFGRLNEYFPGGSLSSANAENSTNMDLWNNSIGIKYGKKTKSRKDLFKVLMKALKKGELIIDPDTDKRKYLGASEIKGDISRMVIVLEENKKGKNRIFYDLNKKLVMKKGEFVTFIKHGDYPNYELRVIGGDEIPVSKKDPLSANNLG